MSDGERRVRDPEDIARLAAKQICDNKITREIFRQVLKEELPIALPNALDLWLDKMWAKGSSSFTKMVLIALGGAVFTALVALILWAGGWHK